MQTVTVSEQGQVIIPLDIRKQLGITPSLSESALINSGKCHNNKTKTMICARRM